MFITITFQMKMMEVEGLLRTVPNLMRSGGEEAEVVLGKSENIKQQFSQLRETLDKRIVIAQRYLAFLKLSSKVMFSVHIMILFTL